MQNLILTLLEENLARFALPIEENINFARDSDNVIKSNNFLKQEYPENLHPENQIKMARLLVKLINAGINCNLLHNV